MKGKRFWTVLAVLVCLLLPGCSKAGFRPIDLATDPIPLPDLKAEKLSIPQDVTDVEASGSFLILHREDRVTLYDWAAEEERLTEKRYTQSFHSYGVAAALLDDAGGLDVYNAQLELIAELRDVSEVTGFEGRTMYKDGIAGQYERLKFVSQGKADALYLDLSESPCRTVYPENALQAVPTLSRKTLREMLRLVSKRADPVLDNTIVTTRTYGDGRRVAVFDCGGKTTEIDPEFVRYAPVYADGRLLYQTVEPNETDFQLAEFENGVYTRYKVETFSVDLEKGKTKAVEFPYVINGEGTTYYDFKRSRSSAVKLPVIRQNDGLAMVGQMGSDNDTLLNGDTLLVDGLGRVAYSARETQAGIPSYRIAKNRYWTEDGKIVDKKLRTVADTGGRGLVFPDRAVVWADGGPCGIVDGNGRPLGDFNYADVRCMFYAPVAEKRDGTKGILSLEDGSFVSLETMFGSPEAREDENGLIVVPAQDGNTVYLPSGQRLCQAQSYDLSPMTARQLLFTAQRGTHKEYHKITV